MTHQMSHGVTYGSRLQLLSYIIEKKVLISFASALDFCFTFRISITEKSTFIVGPSSHPSAISRSTQPPLSGRVRGSMSANEDVC